MNIKEISSFIIGCNIESVEIKEIENTPTDQALIITGMSKRLIIEGEFNNIRWQKKTECWVDE